MKQKRIMFKIIGIGAAATASRVIGQLLIPAGEQSVLQPSRFVEAGTLPLVFTVYGILAFSILAGMYLLVEPRLTGSRLSRGLKYGLAWSLIWIVYLWEPLPHAAPLDRLTYPLADSISLFILGALSGRFLGNSRRQEPRSVASVGWQLLPVAWITGLFIGGRLMLYLVFDIYSDFAARPGWTFAWTALTAVTSALVMNWFAGHLPVRGYLRRRLLVGGFFGVNLLLFNFFMPLVFRADLPDLLLRTAVDTLAVTAGGLAFPTITTPASERTVASALMTGPKSFQPLQKTTAPGDPLVK